MRPRREWIALTAILLLAVGLRFTGLAAGLRHTPHWDERVFVENVRAMVEETSLDHRFYEYPGLLFYLLLPVFMLLPRPALMGSGAYLAARAVIAGFGVVSVALAYRLGSRLSGRGVGLTAALLLAVSPLDVNTAHMVRPDVALGAIVLLAFLAFCRLGEPARGDITAGAAVGAAAAIKFTGLLLVPSYLAARWLSPGPRARRFLLAGLVALAVLLVCTPYAILHAKAYREGVGVQMGAHYVEHGLGFPYGAGLAFYLKNAVQTFGLSGIVLVVLGVITTARGWRAWLPVWLHPIVTVTVMATADLRYERFLVPTTGILAILAGHGLVALLGRRPRLAITAALLVAVVPFLRSLDYVHGVARPNSSDLVLDWILEHTPAGSRVLTSIPALGLDPERFEVTFAPEWEPAGRLLSSQAEYVVAAAYWAPESSGFETLFRVEGRQWGGRTLFVCRAPRRALVAVALTPAALTASDNPGDLPMLLDGRPDTFWQTRGAQRPGDLLEIKLPGPTRIARVELLLGDRAGLYAENLHLFGTTDFTSWKRLRTVPGRPSVDWQVAAPPSQELLIDPTEVRGLRVVQVGRRRKPWGVAELKVWADG